MYGRVSKRATDFGEPADDAGQPRHMRGVTRERVLELWQRLSRGELSAIEGEPWSRAMGEIRKPNNAASGNGATASLFHAERLGRAVPEPPR